MKLIFFYKDSNQQFYSFFLQIDIPRLVNTRIQIEFKSNSDRIPKSVQLKGESSAGGT